MPSPFHGIDIASRALRGFQYALDVTGHNIANVNTRGYSRQSVDFVATDPVGFWSYGSQSLGTGVAIGSINRIRDMFLEARMNQGQSDLGKYQAMASELKGVQELYHEPGDAGISTALDKFFNAWSSLASNPAESANRMAVRSAGQALADRIRSVYANLSEQQSNASGQIASIANQITDLGRRINGMNKEIRAQVATGATPNDLLDQRDQAIQELSSLVNTNITQNADGSVNVYVSQFTLVDTAGASDFPTTYTMSSGTFTDSLGNPITIKSGQLAGLFQIASKMSTGLSQLDTLANTMRTQINGMHKTGTNANATTNLNFFNDVASGPQTGAIDFNLDNSILTDPNNIATGVSGKASDSGLALSISNLRNTNIAALGNRTFLKFHTDNMSSLASDVAYYNNALSTQTAVIDQIDQQQQAVSGVNLDDEMANMLRYQRSYQAAAKALTIFDQTTEDLLGMLRR